MSNTQYLMRRCFIGIILAAFVLFLFTGCRKKEVQNNTKQISAPEETSEEVEVLPDPMAVTERIPVYEKLRECGLTIENPTGLPFCMDSVVVNYVNGMLHTSYTMYYGDVNLYSDVETALTKAYGPPVDSRWNVHHGSVGLGNSGGGLTLVYDYPLPDFDFGKAAKGLTPNGLNSVPFDSAEAVRLMQIDMEGDYEWITFVAYDQIATSAVLEAYETKLTGLGLKKLTDEEVSSFDSSLRQKGYWVTKLKTASYEVVHREEQYDPQRIDTVMIQITDKSDAQGSMEFPEDTTTCTSLHIEGQTMFEGSLPENSVTEEPEASSEPMVTGTPTQTAGDVIDVDVLKAAYASDEKNPEYTDRTVTIRGIMMISRVEMDDFVTMIFGGSESTPPVTEVNCFFSRKAAPDQAARVLELESVKPYTVTGTCKGLAGSAVILTDCTLIEDK